MRHRQLYCREITVHVVHTQARDVERGVFRHHLCAWHRVHRRVVDAAHGNPHRVHVRRTIAVGARHREGVGAAVVEGALIAEGGERRVDVGLRAGEGQGVRAIGPGTDGRRPT